MSFKIIEPELRNSIIQRLKVLRLQDEELLEKTIKKIQELLIKNNVKAEIFGREKKPYSIWKKMKIKSVNFSQLSDIMAFTILIDNLEGCYSILGLLHQKYRYVSLK